MSTQDMAERFARDTANHVMEIKHDDGLYRHLRFQNPDRRSAYWFDIVTWPGTLAIRGDMGDGFMFTRLPDMFEFFRTVPGIDHGINPDYWAEKTEGGRDACKDYSEEMFRQLVIEHFVERVKDGCAPRGLGKALRAWILNDGDIYYEQGARAALESFEYEGFRFEDTWEWDLRDWKWHYLWACHAIQYGIRQYDQARVPAVQGGAR